LSQLYPQSVQTLIDEFNRLPGIGARSAERLAFHVLASSKDEAMRLALAIRDVKKVIKACSRCFNAAEGELCHICSDHKRERGIMCIVELPRDIIAIEKCGGFSGVYHVLQGVLDPVAGVGPGQLRVAELFSRLESDEPITEIILALNPTTEGDATASYLIDEIRKSFTDINVTKLARGLASGTDLESTAPSSLQYAIQGRQGV